MLRVCLILNSSLFLLSRYLCLFIHILNCEAHLQVDVALGAGQAKGGVGGAARSPIEAQGAAGRGQQRGARAAGEGAVQVPQGGGLATVALGVLRSENNRGSK